MIGPLNTFLPISVPDKSGNSGVVPRYHWGFKDGRLPKVGFIPDSPAAFGFLDPSLVVRACHLIPAFADGRTDDLLRHGPTVARPFGEVDDWNAFYVNM